MILWGEDEIVRAWVSQKTGDAFAEGETVGVIGRKGLIGGFVFTNWTGAGIDMSLAGQGCLTREAWQAAGRFAYGIKGCQRIQIITRASNKRVCRIAPRMKFKFEGTARRYYGSEDGKVFSLLRNEAIELGYYREVQNVVA